MDNVSKPWKAADIPAQEGRRYIITGGNSGIGYHAALKLLRMGASVVLACRHQKRGEAAVTQLAHEAPGVKAELAILDLASLASVRRFAAEELARKRPLHVLVNNAGVYCPPRRRQTADGFELQFGTNVLGHFALTGLLLPALTATAEQDGSQPRIVTIASIAHKAGRLNFDDLQSTKSYSPSRAYGQSKLADLIFALELGRRLAAANSPVVSLAAHPGVADTNLFKNEDHSALGRLVRVWAGEIISTVLNTDAEGALPTLYAATSADARNGGYYGPQGWMEMRGDHVGPAKIAAHARDDAAASRLWDVCESLTGVRFL
ncbi:MAG: oxidoreductase [Acidobacteriaceae bacterium]|nr:oxidoreductase [Acidobacteriaceae bacterium]